MKSPRAYLGRATVNTCLDSFKSRERLAFHDGTLAFKPEIIEPVTSWADTIDDLIDAKDYLERKGSRKK